MMLESKCQGLCINCLKSNECAFMKGREGEIYFCEEFETQKGQRSEIACQDTIYFEERSMAEIYGDEYSGICLNCDLKKECSEKFTKGDISFCENHC